jgi:hypothetical protein
MMLLMVTVPPDSVALPMPPFTLVGAMSETSPVGVPDVEVTVTLAVTAVPWVIEQGDVGQVTVRLVLVA